MTNETRGPLPPEDEEAESRNPLSGKQGKGALISKNIRIHNRRTSVRLEPEMWDALAEIAEMEDCSIHDLCGAVHDLKEKEVSFTGALRVFLMEYYRAAARSNRQISQVQKKLMASKNK